MSVTASENISGTLSPATSLSGELARHCMRPVSAAALERACWHLADWVGCAAIGAAQPEARTLFAGLGLVDGQADPWQPLLFQAAVGNMLEMDDLHKQALVHPGPVVIPAALFMARQLNADARSLLEAIVRGYEAMTCLGRSVGPAHYRYWHNTATCGPAGAAAAACSLLQLGQGQWVNAFGHAVTQSAGLWQVRLEPGLSKQWHNARAAQTGVQAAWLARAGAQAPARILEGEKGFYAAMCPDALPGRLVPTLAANPADGANNEWQILHTSLKPWSACRHSHATIDCALQLREQLLQMAGAAALDTCLQQVDTLHVRTYADALAFCDQPEPTTSVQARFSLQHAAAVTLLWGAPTLDAFESNALTSAEVRRLRERVSVALHPDLDAAYPAHFGAEIQLRLKGGTSLQCLQRDAWGDPERPMDETAVRQKADMLLTASTGSEDFAGLIDQCLTLHRAQDESAPLHGLMAQLQALFERLQAGD